MKHVTAYTDGACSGNPGPGGWAAVIILPDGHVRELAGGEPATTNNRMEMRAAIEVLRSLKDTLGTINLCSDSTYVISGLTQWLPGWKRRGWVKSDGKPVLNCDLWKELDALAAARGRGGIIWHHVRGHAGHAGNERCDALAVAFSHRLPVELYDGPLVDYPYGCLDIPA